MTQKDLISRINAIQETNIVDLGKYNSVEAWQEEKLLDLINKHVAEVIGEDDVNKYQRDPSNYEHQMRNLLRAEQRKRAGL